MGNVVSMLRDGLMSLASRMGTDRDKAATTFYAQPLLSDEQIIAAYRGSWLPRKIVDIPALDSCRKWRDWQAKKPQIEAIEDEEKRLNVKGKILEASKKGRLFGGAAVYIGTGDANPAEPLDVERVGKGGLKYLTVMTRRQLTAGEIDRDPASDWYGRPKLYKLSGANGMQMDIHRSRLVIFNGAMSPDEDFNQALNLGWGESVLTSTLDAIKNADSTAGNIASLIFEAKIDIIKVPQFSANIGNQAYEDAVLRRYTLANTIKGINGTLILDSEEEYESKNASFAALTDILMAFMQIVSGAADIPVTRLLGQSPAGMNATGTSDMKNYHDRIQSMQELEMQPAMMRLDECLERSAGVTDPDVYYQWAPLEQMSEKERADIFKTTADAARQLVGTTAGQEIIPREAVSDALVNRLVEDGVLPGLDAAMEEYGKLSEQEPSEEELAAAAAAANENEPSANQRRAANDAAPRTLYVRRDVINRAEIVRWAKEQGFIDIVPDLHVTIAYSRAPVDWFAMGESWASRLEIGAGGPRQMEGFGPDGKYKALLITAVELIWRHREIVEKGASWEWPEYQPHISIQVGGDIDLSKVEPYQGRIILGPEVFEELRASEG
ncbi:anti-CBASS protein Acb1 family protein [Neorhizobium tomejilense]|uniref:anti-CBASS protein Acb1 family protein n=1 Tax=Neorhizobium tomejilense TaxID=2093828 RepID=UPI000CF972ED|nr:anti-CBASS Acb1 family protein [Neorhizobium tomejilense]